MHDLAVHLQPRVAGMPYAASKCYSRREDLTQDDRHSGCGSLSFHSALAILTWLGDLGYILTY